MLTEQTGYRRLPRLPLRRVRHLLVRYTFSRMPARRVPARAVAARWRPADGVGVRGPRSVGAEEEEGRPVVPPGRCRSMPAGRLRDKRSVSAAVDRGCPNAERNARPAPFLFRAAYGHTPGALSLPRQAQARRLRLSPAWLAICDIPPLCLRSPRRLPVPVWRPRGWGLGGA